MKDLIVIDVQGFIDNSKKFIIKDLAFGDINEDHCSRFRFSPPYPEKKLSAKTRLRNQWYTDNLHGLRWDDGVIPYECASHILKNVVRDYRKIAAKGHGKAKFLESIINRKVYNLDKIFPISMKNLPEDREKHLHACYNDHCVIRNVHRLRYNLNENHIYRILADLDMKCSQDEEEELCLNISLRARVGRSIGETSSCSVIITNT